MKGPTNPQARQSLLSHIDPQVTMPQLQGINGIITEVELSELVSSVAVGKAAGEDGITGDFYHSFASSLLPILRDVFREIWSTQVIPKSFRKSLMVLLYKKGAREDLQNWCPISLINLDAKLFSSFLLNRIRPFLPDLIAEEQAGFIQGHSIQCHIHALHIVLSKVGSCSLQGAIVSLDQKKAYDLMEWEFMLEALAKYGFSCTWFSIIKALFQGVASGWIYVNGF